MTQADKREIKPDSAETQRKTRPADTAEQLALARLCQQPCRRLFAAATRLFSDAFAAEPKLANDLGSGARYNAACAAALAGCAQGNDAAALAADEYPGLRQKALAWLRADLTARKADLHKDAAKARPVVRRWIKHWQQDQDFNGVRGETALAKLPEAERREWQKLWEEVAELERGAAATK